MSISDDKKRIEELLNSINSLEISKLYPNYTGVSPWNGMSAQETEKFISDIFSTLKNLKNNFILLDGLTQNSINEIKTQLEQFIDHFEPLKNIEPDKITSHHHNSINNLSALNNILRREGLYSGLKFLPEIASINKKLKIANEELTKFDEQKFKNAISTVDLLIDKKVSYEDKTIKENLGTFLSRASEHKIHRGEKFLSTKFSGQWWWLLFALLMGFIVAGITFSFIKVLEYEKNISTGASILRISLLVVPSYFMYFFINQFNYHKRMYEVYSFKNTATNIMTELMKVNQEKSEYILKEGLKIIFNEPQSKEDVKYDKQLLETILSVIKNK